eukprot:jgi/Tetstr1/442417/TSEL_030541.t1
MTGGDLRLELTLAATNAAVVGTASDWEIGNVELQLEYVEVTSEVDRMIKQANPRDVISYESFANSMSCIAAKEKQINKLAPAQFSSFKTLYSIFRKHDDLAAAASRSVTSRPTCGLVNWYYSVSGENIPQTPVRDNIESFAELQQALYVFGSANLNSIFNLANYTGTAGGSADNTFAVGHNLSHKSTLTESGKNILNTNGYLLGTVAPGDDAYPISTWEHVDAIHERGGGCVANPANASGLLLEAPDLRAANSYESWSGNSRCALTLLQNYATAGVYGLAYDVPYVRRKHIGVEVDFDFVKRLGSMRFRLRHSIGSSEKSAVQAAFDGALLSTHFRCDPIEVIPEHVSAIHRDAGGSPIGRRLLENSWIDFAGVGAGTDAELQALISVLIQPEMTISSALMYVNSTNTIPGTSTADITSGINGSNLKWEYDIGAPNAARYFWVEMIGNNANSSITPLGVYTT